MATYKPIQSTTLTSAVASITFSGIDQTYTDLVIVGSIGVTAAADIQLTYNNDSTSGLYSHNALGGDGTNVGVARYGSRNNIQLDYPGYAQTVLGGTNFIINVQNYSSTTITKISINKFNNGGTAVGYGTNLMTGLWRNTAAITSVTLTASGTTFLAGSTFSLYGINAGTPKATGGELVTTDGNYWYHVFKSTAAFVPTTALSADVLVVAGGGSQGAYYGAAGGAGGLRGLTSQSFALGTSYTCTVGAGGASTGGNTSSRGNNGTNSSIIGGALSISATGGGGGAGAYTGLPYAGGSGGGGNQYSGVMAGGAGNAGGYSPVEGYAGEQGSQTGPNYGGAGGGAGQAGGTNGSGIGGDGSSAYSSWGLATGTGENVSGTVYYAGGGSGNVSPRTGGKGGGGAQTARNGFAAWVGHTNTGGGSGSAADNNGYAAGSGIIIVRYAV